MPPPAPAPLQPLDPQPDLFIRQTLTDADSSTLTAEKAKYKDMVGTQSAPPTGWSRYPANPGIRATKASFYSQQEFRNLGRAFGLAGYGSTCSG